MTTRKSRAKAFCAIAIGYAGCAWLSFPLTGTRVLTPVCLFFALLFGGFAIAERNRWW